MVPPERRISESSVDSSGNPGSPGNSGAPQGAGERVVPSVNPSGEASSEFVAIASLPVKMREDLEDAPFWKEVAAFAQMPQNTLDPYFGKFVAVYNGDIVDSDPDEGELALRFYRTFGYVPVYIHEVGIEDNVIDLND